MGNLMEQDEKYLKELNEAANLIEKEKEDGSKYLGYLLIILMKVQNQQKKYMRL